MKGFERLYFICSSNQINSLPLHYALNSKRLFSHYEIHVLMAVVQNMHFGSIDVEARVRADTGGLCTKRNESSLIVAS